MSNPTEMASVVASNRLKTLGELAALIALCATIISALAYAFGDLRYANREKTEKEIRLIQTAAEVARSDSRVRETNFNNLLTEFRQFKDEQRKFQDEQRLFMTQILRESRQ